MNARDLKIIAEARAACASGELRRMRRRMGLSQREVAAAIGLDHNAIHRWESNRHMPRTEHALLLGRFLRDLAE